ncbi:hypothetical protein NDU88_004384 [Pleurodeles waltl]|uniref:Reverse transcriptase zinc-binding domain-containing protein n=1 Tax=Pleurodeles waltl TaxID=8319 RepID=A0AAV7WS57_PLEWA|nr:hypothetical protein NDU88_004384 [Pleurodeles waltl]
MDDMELQNEKWNTRFGKQGNWLEQSVKMAERAFLASSLKTHHYTTMFFSYYTPAKVRKWAGSGGIRNRCGESEAEIVHMFYTCSKLKLLLQTTELFLGDIIGVRVALTPTLVLLGVLDPAQINDCLNKEKYFLFMAIAILRLYITSNWLKVEPPTFDNWRARLLAFQTLEMSLYKPKRYRKRRWGQRIWSALSKWVKDTMSQAGASASLNYS